MTRWIPQRIIGLRAEHHRVGVNGTFTHLWLVGGGILPSRKPDCHRRLRLLVVRPRGRLHGGGVSGGVTGRGSATSPFLNVITVAFGDKSLKILTPT